MTFISWFNKSAFSLQVHAMYEHNASDYEFVGPVYLRGPLQDSHLIIDHLNEPWTHRKRQYITVVKPYPE